MDDVIYAELIAVAQQSHKDTGDARITSGVVQAYALLRAANITAEGAWPGVVQSGITAPDAA